MALLITFLTACNKDDAAALFLQQTSNELTFPWEGGEKGFAITTNGGAWTVSAPDANWITFDVTSGEGNGKRESVLANVAPNPGAIREGKILIQAGGQQSEIIVRQEDGRITLGEAFLKLGTFVLGRNIEDTYLTIPYQRGIPREQLRFSVNITGDAAGGMEPVVDFNVVLEDPSGEISIPLSGNPTTLGEAVFTISLIDNIHEIAVPSPISETVAKPADFVISGWMAWPANTDANHEYIQFLALRDINFADENFAVITCNNAGQTNGVPPAEGWATGGPRTYKFNITSGTVAKGEYFYVGGTSGRINGPNSTANSIPAAKWAKQHAYNSQTGNDGIGNTTTNLLANSGLTYGVAVFRGTAVDHNTEPMDVVFLRNPETTYTLFGLVNGQNRGFRVTNTDYYTITDVIKYINQYDATNTYYNVASVGGAGTGPHPGQNNFLELRGVYNVNTGRWATARSRDLITLTTSSVVSAIETANSTKMTPAP